MRGKNVVFITVKDESYIRVTQIKYILEKEATSVRVYSSEKVNPVTRAQDLRKRIKKVSFDGVDVIVVGFLPQLIWGSVVKRFKQSTKRPVLVAEMFLSLYDTVILDRKLFRDGWWISELMRKLDGKTVDEADLVLTDTKANAEFISNLYEASTICSSRGVRCTAP